MAGGGQESFDNFYSICGLLGGIVFAISLVPQIWKTFSTKSSRDLSYFWQLTYLVGLTGLGVYAIAYALWPVLAPGLVDFVLMLALTIMKYYYDNIYPRKKEVVEVDVDGALAKEAGDAEEAIGGGPIGEAEPMKPSQNAEGVSVRVVDAENAASEQLNGHTEGTPLKGPADDEARQPLESQGGGEGAANGEQPEISQNGKGPVP